MINDSKYLGKRIQEVRKIRGITQKELGNFLGYSESFISYIEKGDRKVSIDDIQKIAKIFSVDIDFLLNQPKISNFRSTSCPDDTTDYDKMMDDFYKYIDS